MFMKREGFAVEGFDRERRSTARSRLLVPIRRATTQKQDERDSCGNASCSPNSIDRTIP
jgi:hypothetical protein